MSRSVNKKLKGYKEFKKGLSMGGSAKALGKAIYGLTKSYSPKDKYTDFSDKFMDIAKAGSKEDLVLAVQARSKQLNQRFARLEKSGIGTGDTAYHFAKYETGKDKPRYPTGIKTLSAMSEEELLEQGLQVSAKLKSVTSTITGLKELENERLEKAIESINETLDLELDRESFQEFINSGGYEMLNSIYLDSFQVIDDWLAWKEEGITDKQFINRYHSVLNAKKETTRETAKLRADRTFKKLSK